MQPYRRDASSLGNAASVCTVADVTGDWAATHLNDP